MSINILQVSDTDYLQDFSDKNSTPFLDTLPLSADDKSEELFKQLHLSLLSKHSVLFSSSRTEHILQVEYLPWDTKNLEVSTARLQLFPPAQNNRCPENERSQLVNQALIKAQEWGIQFLSIKLPSQETHWINTFADNNFLPQGSELTLLHNAPPPLPQARYAPISPLHQQKVTGMDKLAALFSCSRFANDQNFSPKIVQKMWRTSLENCCNDFADQVYLAKDSSEAIGVLALKRRKINQVDLYSIYLLGVLSSSQRKNIGTSLICNALEYIDNSPSHLTVETQTNNHNALNFYKKNGFNQVLESRICMHCWL